jgi:transcriptional regulator with XRE-family HTH domain
MLTLDEIREKLADRNLEKVSESTGIHRNTLSAIRSGDRANPSYNTLVILNAYFAGAGQ